MPGCGRKHGGFGYCQMHLSRSRRGAPLNTPPVESLPGEEWRDIAGYEGVFQVSNKGRVKSLERIAGRCGKYQQRVPERLLKLGSQGHYAIAHLKHQGVGSQATVHSLVATAFLGPRPPGQQVNHLNADKLDNRVENLEWCTPSENMQHANRLGLRRHPRGEEVRVSRLTEADVRYIRAMRGVKLQRELAEELGCGKSTIWAVQTWRSWRHVV